MNISRVALAINALIFLLIGFIFTFWPEKNMAPIFINALNPSGLIEIRAMYGGLSWGFGLFIVINLLKNEHIKSAVLASGTVLLCMGVVRIAGILMSSDASSLMHTLAAIELGGGILFTVLCLRFPDLSK